MEEAGGELWKELQECKIWRLTRRVSRRKLRQWELDAFPWLGRIYFSWSLEHPNQVCHHHTFAAQATLTTSLPAASAHGYSPHQDMITCPPSAQPPTSISSLVQHDHKVAVVKLLGSKAQGKSPGQVPHLNEGRQFRQALGPLLLHQFCVQLCSGDKAHLKKVIRSSRKALSSLLKTPQG